MLDEGLVEDGSTKSAPRRSRVQEKQEKEQDKAEVVLGSSKITTYPMGSILHDRVVVSVCLSGPNGQGCNKTVAVTVAPSPYL